MQLQRVLVIDFDAAALGATTSLLRAKGFDVVPAGSVDQVLQILAEGSPQVVVIEPALQGRNGFDLCRAILDSCETPPTILLASRKLRGREPHFKAKQVGAQLFLERPASDELLIQAIRLVLSKTSEGSPCAPAQEQRPFEDEQQFEEWIRKTFGPSGASDRNLQAPSPRVTTMATTMATAAPTHRPFEPQRQVAARVEPAAAAPPKAVQAAAIPRAQDPPRDVPQAPRPMTAVPSTPVVAIEATPVEAVPIAAELPPPRRTHRTLPVVLGSVVLLAAAFLLVRARFTTNDAPRTPPAGEVRSQVQSAPAAARPPEPTAEPETPGTPSDLPEAASTSLEVAAADPVDAGVGASLAEKSPPETSSGRTATAAGARERGGEEGKRTAAPPERRRSTRDVGEHPSVDPAQSVVTRPEPWIVRGDHPPPDASAIPEAEAGLIQPPDFSPASSPESGEPDPASPGDFTALGEAPGPALVTTLGAEPRLIAESRVEPRYPPLARRMRKGGLVVLRAVVGTDGVLKDLEIVEEPAGGFGLSRAVIDAVKKWRYEPALRAGHPAEAPITVQIEFRP